MSEALYELMLERWKEFLANDACLFCDRNGLASEQDIEDQYEDLTREFCKKYGYSEKTEELMYGKWWDTFEDEYYQKLEDVGIKIIHENPAIGDWDFGKKFEMGKEGNWKEIGNTVKSI